MIFVDVYFFLTLICNVFTYKTVSLLLQIITVDIAVSTPAFPKIGMEHQQINKRLKSTDINLYLTLVEGMKEI